jgi:hypothetical protein
MDRKNIMTALVILAAVLFATSAFAANITVSQPVNLNGKQLAPGQYKVLYTGSGSDVQVNFIQGKNTVATAPARIEERDRKSNYDALVTDDAGSSREVRQILLGGKKQVLVFSGAGGASAGMGNR